MPFGQAGSFGMLPVANGFAENTGAGFGGVSMAGSLPNGNDLWGMRKQAFQSGGNTMSLPLGMGIGGDPNMGVLSPPLLHSRNAIRNIGTTAKS